MDLQCLCSYLTGPVAFYYSEKDLMNSGDEHDGNNCKIGGQHLKKAIRQEYRMLSDTERSRYHAAVNTLKRSGVFDKIAVIHSNITIAVGAHGEPSFFPWHREYLKRSDQL